MAPEGQVGQKEMKCILKFEKYFHISQCYSGERCGPWASCFLVVLFTFVQSNVYSITSRMLIPFYSIIRSVFYSVFCSVPYFSKHPEVCVYIQYFSPVFLPFRMLSVENNYCNLLISARS
jgi:hypothetical protein